ncbi:hypothetical protein HHK36_007914 [Tetracentron sinense]|uniref:Pentatricopeptide repeat-containing protein n=1 Tax=Tetracentron sinense TaxID=13715 RepID=A0A834ZFI8_TETSI|nr:hypothetical protein HHK36_007914 [Tetracentron sinense]
MAFNDLPTKNTHSWNTILSAYHRTGLLEKAHNLFDEMRNPNPISYNSMISGLTHHGFHRESIDLFQRMQKQYDGLELLRQVHGRVVVVGFEFNLIMYNALVDAYGNCGDPNASYYIFVRMHERDIISWMSMVVAHAHVSRLKEACWLFDQMPIKNVVSWTALITGLAQNGHEALSFFERMLNEGIPASSFTFFSVRSACAVLAHVEEGKQIHGHIIRSSRSDLFNMFLFNALIDMYSKCGDMTSATTLFEGIPEKDIISWNTLVTGFAQNGNAKESLIVFGKMIEASIKPNHVTFIGVLSSCSHKGLVSEGRQILDLMKDCGVHPRSDHYAILIDMLGRNNRLEEVMELIECTPHGSDRVWM